MSGGEFSPPSIGFAVAKSLPHLVDTSRYSLRTVADTGATARTSGMRKWSRQEATRATAPTGGGGPVTLALSTVSFVPLS